MELKGQETRNICHVSLTRRALRVALCLCLAAPEGLAETRPCAEDSGKSLDREELRLFETLAAPRRPICLSVCRLPPSTEDHQGLRWVHCMSVQQ